MCKIMNTRICVYLLLFLSLVATSCEISSRKSAEDNTVYSPSLSRDLDKFDSVVLGMSIREVDAIIGRPIRIDAETGSPEITTDGFFEDVYKHSGGHYLYYSKQINPALDFVRLSILFRNGKVERVENIWYHE